LLLPNPSRCTLTLQNEGLKQPKLPPSGGRADGSASASPPDVETASIGTATSDLIGLDLWPASVALCRYLAAHAEIVAGAAVMELGAGK